MNQVINTWDGAEIYIDKKTSAKKYRYESDSRIETNGVSSNYDHFILHPRKTSECMQSANTLDGDVYNFLNLSGRSDFVGNKYKVRQENRFRNGQYTIDKRKYDQLVKKYVTPLRSMQKPILTIARKKFIYQGKYSLTATGIVPDVAETREQANHFVSRILDSQKSNDTYYYFYQQLISDHLPIYMRCQTN